jgi:dynein heavy chain, axonemal
MKAELKIVREKLA